MKGAALEIGILYKKAHFSNLLNNPSPSASAQVQIKKAAPSAHG
jgi:hypothetical protein